MSKEMELCVPCSIALGEHYKLKKVREVVNKKITCAECLRRRYGAVYTMEGKRSGQDAK